MSVGNLEEIIDDNHAIVSTSVGSEHYVSILSFVDKDLLEPGCSVLLNHKVWELYSIFSVSLVFVKGAVHNAGDWELLFELPSQSSCPPSICAFKAACWLAEILKGTVKATMQYYTTLYYTTHLDLDIFEYPYEPVAAIADCIFN